MARRVQEPSIQPHPRHQRRGRRVGGPLATVSCPVAERIATQTGFGLSQHVLLGTRREIDDVVAAVVKVATHAHELALTPIS